MEPKATLNHTTMTVLHGTLYFGDGPPMNGTLKLFAGFPLYNGWNILWNATPQVHGTAKPPITQGKVFVTSEQEVWVEDPNGQWFKR